MYEFCLIFYNILSQDGFLATTVAIATLLICWVLKFVVVPQALLMHGLSLNFQDMFTQKDLELIRFLGGYLATTVAMESL